MEWKLKRIFLVSAPLSSAPTHVPVPRSLNCLPRNCAVQRAAFSVAICASSVRCHAVGLAGKQALTGSASNGTFSLLCAVLALLNFSCCTLDLCGHADKRLICYRLAATMLRGRNAEE